MNNNRPTHELLIEAIESTRVESINILNYANERPKIVVTFYAKHDECVEMAKYLKKINDCLDFRDE